MTKNEIYEKVKEFANGGSIDIALLDNNLKITMTPELWTEYICQILKITE